MALGFAAVAAFVAIKLIKETLSTGNRAQRHHEHPIIAAMLLVPAKVHAQAHVPGHSLRFGGAVGVVTSTSTDEAHRACINPKHQRRRVA